MSWWDDIKNAVNSIPGAGEVNKLGSSFANEFSSSLGQYPKQLEQGVQSLLGGLPSLGGGGGGSSRPAATPATDPGQMADFLIGKVPDLTYGQINNPSPQLVQQLAQSIAGMSPSDAEDVLKALPSGSKLASSVESVVNPASAQQLYGFDPLSMANIFQQSFAPFIRQNQSMLQGDIANYGKEMQQALAGASPQYRQAYAVSNPGLQQALSMQNAAASNEVVQAPEMDALMQNLANATNAAKAAGSYAQIAPYYQALIGGIGTPAATGATGTAGASPMVTPFTYGSPTSTSQLQTMQAQQALLGLAQQAQTGG